MQDDGPGDSNAFEATGTQGSVEVPVASVWLLHLIATCRAITTTMFEKTLTSVVRPFTSIRSLCAISTSKKRPVNGIRQMKDRWSWIGDETGIHSMINMHVCSL